MSCAAFSTTVSALRARPPLLEYQIVRSPYLLRRGVASNQFTLINSIQFIVIVVSTMRRTSPQPSPSSSSLLLNSTANSFTFLGGNAPQLVGRTSPSTYCSTPRPFCGCSRIVTARPPRSVSRRRSRRLHPSYPPRHHLRLWLPKPDRLVAGPFGTRALQDQESLQSAR